ncbi:MAG: DegV family EDD domain-containing protein [Acidobacteria bacterium]|nr:DegV family EDD domain-containing protein [Acidobacteriota bacterium]
MVRELDGHQVFGLFREGARSLDARRAELDRINVFPVPDGDTGSNMALTLRFAVEAAQVSDSAALTLGSLAESALAGARGNSGVILAQFIVGLAESLGEAARVDMERFARAVAHAYASARHAVREPRDGTILSVIRDWAAALHREQARSSGFPALFRAAHPDLEQALAATTGQLEVLRAAGVVDAGASGFVAFVAGGSAYLESGAPRLPEQDVALPEAPFPEDAGWDMGADPRKGPRYCSEFFLLPASGKLDLEALGRDLDGQGDSLIVAGGARGARVHIHTDDPAGAMNRVAALGRVRDQKVDDMHRQFEDARLDHGRVALLTDSCCDLPQELLDRHRIHVVPLTLRFGEVEYLDRLTLDPATLYDRLDAAPVFPASSQPAPAVFERAYQRLLAHHDRVLALHVASRLSGTFEASRRAAARIDPARITVLDTKHLSGSLGLLVLQAARLLESGLDPDTLVAQFPALRDGASILVSVRTLESMVRGGRVSPLGGRLARLLNLKPIVSVDETGASKLYGAAFSVEQNLRKIVRMVAERHTRAPIRSWAVVHGANPAGARDLASRVERVLGFPPEHLSGISAVVGMNAGRGAVAVVSLSF